MVDFSKLLKKPAGQAKAPEALPQAIYPGIIKSHSFGESPQKKTPYVRYEVALTGWPDEVDESLRVDSDGEAIDLSKKSFQADFYISDGALFMLDRFLDSMGISMEGRTYEETIPEAVGMGVLVPVNQQINQETGNSFNPKRVDGLSPLE